MTAMNGCTFCKTGWKRWNEYACNECSGRNSRKSYDERTKALAARVRDLEAERDAAKVTRDKAHADFQLMRDLHDEVERERDEAIEAMAAARAEARDGFSVRLQAVADSIEAQTAEAIATWLDSGPDLDAPGFQAAASSIRAGAWRKA